MVIRVAVIRSQDDPLAEIVEAEIRAAPDLSLIAAERLAPEADDRIPALARQADTLIAIGVFDGAALRAALDDDGPVVCNILIEKDAVSVHLRRTDVQQLMDTIRALSLERWRDGVRLFEYQATGGASGGFRFVRTPTSDDGVTRVALAWARAAILAHWRRQAMAGAGPLGLARSPEVMAALLAETGPQVDDASEAGAFATVLERLVECPTAPLALLRSRLDLADPELKLCLLAIAPELDAAVQVAFGILNDEIAQRTPTLALACAIVGEPVEVRGGLYRAGHLPRWHLLDAGGAFAHGAEPIRLAPPLAAWLSGGRRALVEAPGLRDLLRPEPYPGSGLLHARGDASIAAALADVLRTETACWLALPGRNVDLWRARAEIAAEAAHAPLLRCRADALAELPAAERRAAIVQLVRAARLMHLTLAVDFRDAEADVARRGLLAEVADVAAAAPQAAILIATDLDGYLPALRMHPLLTPGGEDVETTGLAAIYRAAAAEAGIVLPADEVERLALDFPLGLDAIEDAVALASLAGAADGGAFARIARACARVASPNLSRLAKRVTPGFSLDQVHLPAASGAQLAEIVGNMHNAGTVLHQWGFAAQLPYGRGVAALFSGPSGTGKTMASHAIAHALERQVFEVDLSRVTSKYVGETEKNLDVVFSEAEAANGVLCFQEAEGLLGKRGLQKDAHDRYANMEVAYLLQRMETYSGLAILTTNFRQNIDQAFLRRLRFVVDFPKPDAAAREAIWRQCLPPEAPLEPGIDLAFLARQIDLTGGSIRQITLRAAFAAAASGTPIGIGHLLAATRAELAKLGGTGARRELEAVEAVLGHPSREWAA